MQLTNSLHPSELFRYVHLRQAEPVYHQETKRLSHWKLHFAVELRVLVPIRRDLRYPDIAPSAMQDDWDIPLEYLAFAQKVKTAPLERESVTVYVGSNGIVVGLDYNHLPLETSTETELWEVVQVEENPKLYNFVFARMANGLVALHYPVANIEKIALRTAEGLTTNWNEAGVKVPACKEAVETSFPSNATATEYLIVFDANGTVDKEGTLLVEYKYDTAKAKGGSLWLNNLEYRGSDANILQLKVIMDAILDSSQIARKCYDEMIVMRKLFASNHKKRESVRIVIGVYGISLADGDAKGFEKQYSSYEYDKDNTICISPEPAPTRLISRTDKTTLLISNNLNADVFHELFGHAYDAYTDKTMTYIPFQLRRISVVANSTTLLNYPPPPALPHWNNFLLEEKDGNGISIREEFSVHMENLYRNEQKLDLRYTYYIEMVLPPAPSDLGGVYFESGEVILIEVSPKGFRRLYQDKYEYEIVL
ncbi:MAG: hypothetical protein ACKVTZ_05845 [Bacteroidia bacterium]